MRALAARAVCALLLVSACSGGSSEPQSVVVPGIRDAGLEFAYRMLHEAGLRVEIVNPFHFYPLLGLHVRFQDPVGATVVAAGSVVRITELMDGALGSPGVRGDPLIAVVPDFVGESVATASAWAVPNEIEVQASFPPLPPSDAPSLGEAYVITAQEPAQGSTLSQGVSTGNGYQITPLMLEVKVR